MNPSSNGTPLKPDYIPGEPVARHVADEDLVWTEAEKQQVAKFRAEYPTNDGAVMKVLWLAQNKFGWLPPEVVQFVADTIEVPYAKVYGVATFYTQYYKEKKGKYVLDVCTCFGCQVCGGYDILHYLEEKLEITKGETTSDELFTIQEVECLGACGSAPMLQVTNGPYVHNLTKEKVDGLIDGLRAGKMPEFESVTLPQDETDFGGNRRSDTNVAITYQTPPVSETIQ
ncbi:MAG: NAD(P)H-dependent oxidoreductase subunit E [Rubricoccaceae bacterium]|nr:NAD(P)H-dependent oxidoreductase subunit E [Rubricoccaceae bacterium]